MSVKQTEGKITALYERLSRDDELAAIPLITDSRRIRLLLRR